MKDETGPGGDQSEPHEMVPAERLLEIDDREAGEDDEGDDLLDRL
jgi:hypothetical protein